MCESILLVLVLAQPALVSPEATPVTAAQQVTAQAAPARPEQPWPPDGVVRLGQDVVPPRMIKETKPRYTPEAMDAKIHGSVSMEVVVKADGTVGDVRVTKSLDREYGLDEAAVAAVKKWEFQPGKKDGEPVPVLVEIEMTFSLRDNR